MSLGLTRKCVVDVKNGVAPHDHLLSSVGGRRAGARTDRSRHARRARAGATSECLTAGLLIIVQAPKQCSVSYHVRLYAIQLRTRPWRAPEAKMIGAFDNG